MAQLTSSIRSGHTFSSRQCSIRGSQSGLQFQRGPAVVVMAKKGLHPDWHAESKVICNGEEVLVTSGTKKEYTVDIWSGNHPFFQGVTTTVVTDEGRVNRFKRRFSGLESLAKIETAADAMARQKVDAAK